MSPKRRQRIDERWERTPGGLLVPSRPTLPTRRFIQKWGQAVCCCDVAPPQCLCMSVIIDGVANGTCAECDAINRDTDHAWRLAHVSENHWSCTVDEFCGVCGDTTIALNYDPDTGIWTATAAGITWQAEGNDCGSLGAGLELIFVEDDGVCDGSGSTATIALHTITEAQPCECGCVVTCPQCVNNNAAPLVEVVISGVADSAYCSTGCDEVNGTHTLTYDGCGTNRICCNGSTWGFGPGPYWGAAYATHPCDTTTCNYRAVGITFSILRETDGEWKVGVSFGPVSSTTCSNPSDCQEGKNLTGFYKLLDYTGTTIDCLEFEFADFTACSAPEGCDVSGATCSVRSLSND